MQCGKNTECSCEKEGSMHRNMHGILQPPWILPELLIAQQLQCTHPRHTPPKLYTEGEKSTRPKGSSELPIPTLFDNFIFPLRTRRNNFIVQASLTRPPCTWHTTSNAAAPLPGDAAVFVNCAPWRRSSPPFSSSLHFHCGPSSHFKFREQEQ